MAIEDGVRAREGPARSAIDRDAFRPFEAARRERVEKIVAYGARSSSNKTPGRIGSLFRDAFMRSPLSAT